jgi:hypothetical protein
MWRGVVFLVRHPSVILVTGIYLSVLCNLLDTRYISLDDTSYHRKEFYLTAYYLAAQPFKLCIRPVIRILNILYYHDSGLDSTKSQARYDRNPRIQSIADQTDTKYNYISMMQVGILFGSLKQASFCEHYGLCINSRLLNYTT